MLKPYHFVWLKEHPHRTEEWLQKMMKEGFDIHHLDGDHSNNNPDNLVLIEHTDHMLIHNGNRFFSRYLRPSRYSKPRKLRRCVLTKDDLELIEISKRLNETPRSKEQGRRYYLRMMK